MKITIDFEEEKYENMRLYDLIGAAVEGATIGESAAVYMDLVERYGDDAVAEALHKFGFINMKKYKSWLIENAFDNIGECLHEDYSPERETTEDEVITSNDIIKKNYAVEFRYIQLDDGKERLTTYNELKETLRGCVPMSVIDDLWNKARKSTGEEE